MDRLHQLRAFVAVAESGGFAKAATRLRSSPPAVTRAVAALEQHLGGQLFMRTTRVVQLTEAGRRFLERARQLLIDLDSAEKELSGGSGIPTGHLTITASVVMGRSVLLPVVTGFLKAHPPMTAQVILLDRVVNLVEEGIDVGLRIGHLPDSSLIARQVGEVRRVLVASPAYIARRGRPAAPADLKQHSIIAFTGLQPNRDWNFGAGKAASRVTLVPRLLINDGLAAIAAAEAGEGIAIAVSYMVADLIRARRLVPLLNGHGTPPVPVHLVYPESRLVAPKLRAFVDHAAPRLRAALRALALPPARSAALP
ncbi:MAG: LysR family transcriptional regulator [Dongiaceae bacterium]